MTDRPTNQPRNHPTIQQTDQQPTDRHREVTPPIVWPTHTVHEICTMYMYRDPWSPQFCGQFWQHAARTCRPKRRDFRLKLIKIREIIHHWVIGERGGARKGKAGEEGKERMEKRGGERRLKWGRGGGGGMQKKGKGEDEGEFVGWFEQSIQTFCLPFVVIFLTSL